MEREPPVGSSDSELTFDYLGKENDSDLGSNLGSDKFKILETERDDLQKSMISLTSRLAQVKMGLI